MRAGRTDLPRGSRDGRPRAGRRPAGPAKSLWIALALLAGCATANPYGAGTFARAQHYAEHGKSREAVTAIEQFLRLSPADTLAPRAQFLKAQQYMKLKEYPLAAVELQILRREYPLSPLVEEALFLQGVAHFKQVGRLERDISHADSARVVLRRFLAAYPNSPHAGEARDYLSKVSELRIRKKMGEAKVFEQLDQPAAAGVVLDVLLGQERDSPLLAQALLQRARYALEAKQPDTAAAALNRLVTDFPESPQAAEARRLLARLGPGAAP